MNLSRILLNVYKKTYKCFLGVYMNIGKQNIYAVILNL